MRSRAAIKTTLTATGISFFLAIGRAASIGGVVGNSNSHGSSRVFGLRSVSVSKTKSTVASRRLSTSIIVPRGGGFTGTSTSTNHIRSHNQATSTTISTSTSSRNMSSDTTTASSLSRSVKAQKITGLPLGPYPIGVTTVQIDGNNRNSKRSDNRGLQTEVWYPATDAALQLPITKFSDYLGLDLCKDPAAALRAANADNAIGGYRDGISVEELDDPARTTWLTNAIRDAPARKPSKDDANNNSETPKWPLVLFSHGSGAYRASYSFWVEYLASHGYVVAACDHPGSARFTIVDGEVITPGGPRSKRQQMETDRPLDLLQIIDGIEAMKDNDDNAVKSIFRNDMIDTNNVAITGMSFGGFTTTATLEFQDPRITAAVMMCSSMAMSGTQAYHTPARNNKSTPVMIMIGTEDTVLGDHANDANRKYVDTHDNGDAYLLEIVRGGHVSFTSCEMYDPEYGNGIAVNSKCKMLTEPGNMYSPLDIVKQHEIINNYGLHFLNKYMKKEQQQQQKDDDGGGGGGYLAKNHYDKAEVIYRSNL